DQRSLGTRAVIADDVNNERIIEFAHIFDGLDYPANLMIGISEIGCVDVGLADEEFLLIGGERIPFLEQIFGPRSQFGVLGNDAEPLLISKNRLAQLVPTLVKQVHVTHLLDSLPA